MLIPKFLDQYLPSDSPISEEQPVGEPEADPDMSKSFQQIVQDNGFIFESHPVTTQDGYKLNLFRIKSQGGDSNKPIVFLQHGILDSADCWIMHYNNVAPAFQLVRAGYDVWLGNQRGNKYSRSHTSLDVNSKAYWQFSFTEMGEYDAPAQIEYALSHTGRSKVTYIGHSQGTSQMFAALARNPDYWRQKVNLFVALAPVTSLHDTTSPLVRLMASIQKTVEDVADKLHIYTIFGDGISDFITSAFCKNLPDLCNELQRLATSHDPNLDDAGRF